MIFVIDDESDLVSSLTRRLYLRGYAVRGVENSESALQSVEEGKDGNDFLLIDYGMKSAEGSRMLWQDFLQKGLPLYLMTGHGSGFPGKSEILQQGVAGIFHKPVALEEIERVLKQHGIAAQKAPT